MATALPQVVSPQSHVGFDSITNQIEKKLLKRGFQFNVICVGTKTISCFAAAEKLTLNRRTNRPRKVHLDQHHLRLASPELQGSRGSRRAHPQHH